MIFFISGQAFVPALFSFETDARPWVILKKIIEFCLSNALIEPEHGAWLLSAFERRHEHPIRIVIGHGVDEDALFKAASEYYGVPLIHPDTLTIDPDRKDLLARNIQDSFDCMVIEANNDRMSVMSWNFYKTSIIPAALENITGKKTTLYLITCSHFDQLKACLFPQ